MNMLLHGVKDSEFEIYHGDTLTNDWDMLRETEPGEEADVRRGGRQPAVQLPLGPERGAGRGRALQELRAGAQESAADFAFLLHGFHYLKDDGVMAIILPHGVLFRGGAEATIRRSCSTTGTSTPSSACRRTCSTRPAFRSASSC